MQQQYNQYPAINSNRIIYFNLFFFLCVFENCDATVSRKNSFIAIKSETMVVWIFSLIGIQFRDK